MTINKSIRCTTVLLLACVSGPLVWMAGSVGNGENLEGSPPSSLRQLGQVIATLPSAPPPADTKSGFLEIEEEARDEDIKAIKQKKETESNTDDTVTFTFTMGLEGTGHHLLRAIFRESPDYHTKKDMGWAHSIGVLHKNLYKSWDGFCNLKTESDGQKAFDKLVDALQETRRKIGDREEPFTVMLNAADHNKMYSYPTNSGECRAFRYPDMDGFYAACDAAGVRCGHIYLYRDPYQFIHSDQRRHFNPTITLAIKLYYSMLGVIMSQLYAYPERTLACWNFFDGSSGEERENRMRDMFGWKNDTAFKEKIEEIIVPHTPMTEDEKLELVPPKIQVYMDSMIKAHDRVVELCRAQIRDNGYLV